MSSFPQHHEHRIFVQAAALRGLILAAALLPLMAYAVPPPPGPTLPGAAILWSEIGAKASQQYEGDALHISATSEGALLRCGFQKMEGNATKEGLWLTSTEDGSKNDRLRVVAAAIGRGPDPFPPSLRRHVTDNASPDIPLAMTGAVELQPPLLRFVRPGLTEEYSVSVDGVRQDFIISQRPAGRGILSVSLALTGARAEAATYGAELTLERSKRALAYSRLRAVDATGKELHARMEVRSPNHLSVLVEDAAAIYPIRIDPTFSDANWSSMGNFPGTDGVVNAIAVDSNAGLVYVGGSFSSVGTLAANDVAVWNGSKWSALGSGISGSLNSVLALAVIGTDLYAGGAFSKAGEVSVNDIAKWNGSAWSALGAGMNERVSALAVLGSDLYAGGMFTMAFGVTNTKYIAKWNGSAWSALGTGMNERVSALAVLGSDLYAGGVFTSAGGAANTNYIAKWNGSAWSALGTGMNSVVDALAASGSNLYAGGLFTSAGGVANTNYIGKWDGNTSAWSSLGTGLDQRPVALAVLGTDLYAGGGFTTAGGVSTNRIAKWNGSAWSALGTGMDGTVLTLAALGDSLYVGGLFTSAGGTDATHLAKWNGSDWSTLSPGAALNGTVTALVVSGSDLYAGGSFTKAGDITINRIAKWNGTAWSALGLGLGGSVRALAVNGNDLFAGGDFLTAGQVSAIRIAKWDGRDWSALGTGMDDSVSSLAVIGSELYAGGDFTSAGGISASCIAKWNGSAWSALGLGVSYIDGFFTRTPHVYALAVLGTDLYVGGFFNSPANFIAKWNGSAWSSVGNPGTNDRVYALAVSNGNLYAAGDFTAAGGAPANAVAKWNGSAWSAQGSAPGGINALAVSGTRLYAGGQFATAEGAPASHIAQWNGSDWSPIGSGTNKSGVAALVADGSGNLFVGGDFTVAGSTPSPYAAKVDVRVQEIDVEQPAGESLTDAVSIIDFDSFAPGSTSPPKIFTIKNVGTRLLTVSGVSIIGGNSADFSVNSAGTSSSVAPGGSTTFSIAFHPTALGARASAVRVDNDDDNENPFVITVTGTGAQPAEIAVVEQSGGVDLTDGVSRIDLGNLSVGTTSSPVVFMIKNTGGITLALGSVMVSGGNSTDFIVNTAGMSAGVPPGSSTTLSLTFSPGGLGGRSTTLRIASDDADENPFDIPLTGAGVRSGINFLNAINFVNEEGETAGTVNIPISRGAGSTGPVSVKVNSTTGTAGAADFTPLVNREVIFGPGQILAFVPVTITSPDAAEGNEDFTLTLSDPLSLIDPPDPNVAIGAGGITKVRIVEADDATIPTVTIATPFAGAIIAESAGTTVNVTGAARDNRGVKSVEVQLNGGPFVAATLARNATGTSATYALPVTAVDGTNTLVVKSTDTRNNESHEVKHTFTRVVMRPLVVNIDSPIVPATDAGTVTAGYMPPPTPVLRQVGKSYTITATAKTKPAPGFVFDGWTVSGGPTLSQVGVTPIALEKPTLTFTFRQGLVLTARFIANPFSFVSGTYNGLVRSDPAQPGAGTIPGVDTEGFINVVLQSTGAFSATLSIDGLVLPFSGLFDNNTPLSRARFGTSREQTAKVSRPGKSSLEVRLFLDLATPGVDDKITGTVTQNLRNVITAVSNVDADRAFYGSVKRPADTTAGSATLTMASTGGRSVDEAVSGSVIPPGTRILSLTDATHLELTQNALATSAGTSLTFTRAPEDAYLTIGGLKKTSGVFTAIFSSKGPASQPKGFTPESYPQGDGFARITVSPAGVLSLAGTLADNTAVSASAPLARHSVAPFVTCPIFSPLYKGKGGALIGEVTLDSSQPLSDMSAMDGDAPPNAPFLWFRPFQDVQHYPYGWAEGVQVDFLGAKFLAAPGFSVLTGHDSTHNADLIFSDGGLNGSISKVVSLSIADIVTKVPTTDGAYTLIIHRSTGKISGTFTHNVSNTNPTFQGMIFQKGTGRGAYGFFLTTTPEVKDYTGQSGGVSLVPQP